jgi:long-subunit acyl-CoA synthetase (AMP-forming)
MVKSLTATTDAGVYTSGDTGNGITVEHTHQNMEASIKFTTLRISNL